MSIAGCWLSRVGGKAHDHGIMMGYLFIRENGRRKKPDPNITTNFTGAIHEFADHIGRAI
jgi:hypothetical protein